MNQLLAKMDGAAETLRRQMDHLSSNYRQAEQSIAALGQSLSDRGRQLGKAADEAVGKVSLWEGALRNQAENINRSLGEFGRRAQETSTNLEAQSRQLHLAADEARSVLDSLNKRKDDVQTTDFLQQMSYVTERLQSAAVDLSRSLEVPITEDEWKRFNAGETGIFVRKMLGFREKAKLDAIARMYRENGEFRDYAGRYISEFERMLHTAARRDPDNMLRTTLLSSDVGKVYMILARALGRNI